MALIEIENIRKEYSVQKGKSGILGGLKDLFSRQFNVINAVDGIDLAIEKGECIGFIGPNGAGKSTLIKMLTGILYPTSGEIRVNGIVPYKQRKENAWNIGVIFGQRTQLWWDLPAIESFQLLKHIYKLSDEEFRTNLGVFEELLELGQFLDVPVRQLSLGQRMRADFAASLLHRPGIIFLDEPTIGLDVLAKERIREFIKYLNEEKKTTVFFTTHDMQDIEKVCKRLTVIDGGKIIFDGSVSDVKEKYKETRTLIVDFIRDYKIIDIPLVDEIKSEGKRKWISFHKDKISASSLIKDIANKYEVRDISIQEPGIDEIVKKIYNWRSQ